MRNELYIGASMITYLFFAFMLVACLVLSVATFYDVNTLSFLLTHKDFVNAASILFALAMLWNRGTLLWDALKKQVVVKRWEIVFSSFILLLAGVKVVLTLISFATTLIYN